MNDEVSVTELLAREGWGEPERKPNGRMRMVAVMLAVVLGCGLAAILVHFGSLNSQADAPSPVNTPHGPTGGLAGGGVPDSPTVSETTETSTTVVVTNESEAQGTIGAGIPWHTRDSRTQTVTDTGSAGPSLTGTSNPNGGATVTTTGTRVRQVPETTRIRSIPGPIRSPVCSAFCSADFARRDTFSRYRKTTFREMRHRVEKSQ